ncbi:phosphodiester glycosidase family protein [Chryseobacterium sp. Leaf405]|uniref:phosphodiester glycosidase family protein n=1 Tax=Chryseobacterium sp. Leaf405 TaxID=1736367 RepID=UPI000AA913B9|nr:phosphodiester glycosidase family protein [Chryseobacterium sp. Leaf405]
MKLNIACKILIFSLFVMMLSCYKEKTVNNYFVIYSTNAQKENIEFYWKDEKNQPLKSIRNLKTYVSIQNKALKFAMNGGMYSKKNIPKGLYIENFKTLHPIDTLSGAGNFYLKPNGIFYITKSNTVEIIPTENFKQNSPIKFAIQSGPMLINKGKINLIFQQNSNNLNIRNGAGILKNGNIIFAMSKKEINFYNFALFFKKIRM